MEASQKSPHINAAINEAIGKDRITMIAANRCVICNEATKDFKDKLSEKEYTISGMCQACQDKVWG